MLVIQLQQQFVDALLNGIVVIPRIRQPVAALDATAPQTADDLKGKFVNGFARLFGYQLKISGVDGAADGVFSVLALVDHDSFAVSLENIPVLALHPIGNLRCC